MSVHAHPGISAEASIVDTFIEKAPLCILGTELCGLRPLTQGVQLTSNAAVLAELVVSLSATKASLEAKVRTTCPCAACRSMCLCAAQPSSSAVVS